MTHVSQGGVDEWRAAHAEGATKIISCIIIHLCLIGLTCCLPATAQAQSTLSETIQNKPATAWSAKVEHAQPPARPKATRVTADAAVGPARTFAAQATTASLSGDAQQTVFRLQLSKGVTAEVFTLANPYRVIVDMPGVGFQLDEAAGKQGRGLITAFRFGQFAEGKSRIVIDVAQPVLIAKAGMTALPSGTGIELAIVLEATSQQSFGSGTGAATQQPETAAIANPPAPRANRTKPVILIDPGHGGIDGGTVGSSNLIEKNVVLAVAKELQRQLGKSNRYDVRMTRTTDVFVSLDRRLKLSRDAAADLFISLHADSIADPQAVQSVRGATVYTLSERASDEQARRMAEKENASDLIAGLDGTAGDSGGEVKGILIDLMKRETANFSADFSTTLVGSLKRNVHLSRDPQRSAAFKVLKQTHAPSILLELGYLSHNEDQKLLNSANWQRTAAESIVRAIDAFFAKQDAGAASRP